MSPGPLPTRVKQHMDGDAVVPRRRLGIICFDAGGASIQPKDGACPASCAPLQ